MIKYHQRVIKMSLKNRSCLLEQTSRWASSFSAMRKRFECERDRWSAQTF